MPVAALPVPLPPSPLWQSNLSPDDAKCVPGVGRTESSLAENHCFGWIQVLENEENSILRLDIYSIFKPGFGKFKVLFQKPRNKSHNHQGLCFLTLRPLFHSPLLFRPWKFYSSLFHCITGLNMISLYEEICITPYDTCSTGKIRKYREAKKKEGQRKELSVISAVKITGVNMMMNGFSDIFRIYTWVYITQVHMYVYTHICKYFMYVCHFPQPLILATTRLRARC